MNRPFITGTLASLALLTLYFIIVSLVSGWNFAQEQFRQFWYYLVALAAGFGVQVGLYTYLRNIARNQVGHGIVAGSGITSGTAMTSCCLHYLANFLPILGISGLVALVSQYQIELFWLGLIFNLAGIIYMVTRIIRFRKAR